MAPQIRKLVLEVSKQAGVGHIGSELSIVEIIASLYGGVMHVPAPTAPERDRFVLSKGHAALALYSALHLRGWISQGELFSYCSDGSALGVHPERGLPGIDFATGSLGQGLSVGAGAALAARLRGLATRVFVLLSDAECNEGAVWEAVMFAAHHRLGNLTAVIDLNGQQALGYTDDVLKLSPMAPKWSAFGWEVDEVPGHDIEQLSAHFSRSRGPEACPRVVIARTTFGKGVSFMEGKVPWHYLPMSDAEYRVALSEQAG